MNIIEALAQLRDDIKLWVTNNLNELNKNIADSTVSVDSELSSTSTNPVQNKVINEKLNDLNTAIENKKSFSGNYNDLTNKPSLFSGDYNDLENKPIDEDSSGDLHITDEAGNIIMTVDAEGIHTTDIEVNGKSIKSKISEWDNKSNFSGNYNDLTDAPDIMEDESGDMVIADEAGNIIFKADSEGIHTTELEVAGGKVSAHITDTDIHVTEEEKAAWGAKSNFSGSYNDLTDAPIEEDSSGDMVIADESGNIIMKVDADGIHTTKVNAESVKINGDDIVDILDQKITDLVDSAPEKMNTIGELAIAMETNSDAIDALVEIAGSKATKDELNAVSGQLTTHTTDTTVHVTADEKEAWDAKSNFSGSYNDLTDKPELFSGNYNDLTNKPELFSGDYKDLTNAPDIEEDNEGNMVIADEAGNLILKVDEAGLETTKVTSNEVVVNGSSVTGVDDNLNDTSINPVQNKVITDKFSKYSTTEQLNTTLQNYATAQQLTEVDNKFANYTTTEELNNTLRNYSTTEEINNTLQNYTTTEQLNTTLEDYATTEELDKVIKETVVIDDELSTESVNPVQNKVITEALSAHTGDGDIHVTVADKTKWNNKSDFSGDFNELKNNPIVEDHEGNLVVTDNDGNIIFKTDADGFETTKLTVNELVVNGHNVTGIDDTINSESTNPVQNKVIADKFSKYATTEESVQMLTTVLQNYATTEDLNNAVSNVSIDVDTEISTTSENPVQNKVIAGKFADYSTTEEINTTLQNYVTTEDLSEEFTIITAEQIEDICTVTASLPPIVILDQLTYGTFEADTNMGGMYIYTAPVSHTNTIPGKTYYVSWDNVVYYCTCRDIKFTLENKMAVSYNGALGNAYLPDTFFGHSYTVEDKLSASEPFLISITSGTIYIRTKDGSPYHRVGIYTWEE